MSPPLVVGIGGTPGAASSTAAALRTALAAAERLGVRTVLFDGDALAGLPLYLTPGARDHPVALELIAAVRSASGLIIASPGYHGSVSGLVKNALDYLEALARDERPYLHGLPVGLIATAWGWQATGTTLAALRSIVHALRGWPTPLGAAVNTAQVRFAEGRCSDASVAQQLALIGEQVASFRPALPLGDREEVGGML
ncbi:NADPH-dependent FMN reductase [Sphingomonas elodea]|uniref:NADPH-dependent FMN reductase n=1 Tax=Sphingomonas elodea TaxID=179878 RepID=UPI0002630D0A|nr:NADPH-dependent FMN reductase [Sphingomonas elodea]